MNLYIIRILFFLLIVISVLSIGCSPEKNVFGTGNFKGSDLSDYIPPVTGDAQIIYATEDMSPVIFTLNAGENLQREDLFYTVQQPPSNGNILGCFREGVADSRNCQYYINSNFFGEDYLTYYIGNGFSISEVQRVRIVVVPVNDDPTISLINDVVLVEGDVSIVSFIVDEGGDFYENGDSIILRIESSNLLIMNPSDFTISWRGRELINNNGVFEVYDYDLDMGVNSLELSITPVNGNVTTDLSAPVTITVWVSDNGGVSFNASETFDVTISSGDDDPSIVNLSGNQNVDEGTVIQNITFNIDEGGYELFEDLQNLQIQVISSNDTVIDNTGFDLSWGGSPLTPVPIGTNAALYNVGDGTMDALSRPLVLNLTPVNGVNTYGTGPISITVGVSDDGGVTWITTSFIVTINVVDMPPALITISNPIVVEGTAASLNIVVDEGGSADEDSQIVEIRITSTNESVVSASDINIAGSGSNVFTTVDGALSADAINNLVVISPNQNPLFSGTVLFNIELSDDGGVNYQTTSTFNVLWSSTPNNAVITAVNAPDRTVLEGSSLIPFEYTIDEGGGVSEDYQDLRVRITSTAGSGEISITPRWGGTNLSTDGVNSDVFFLGDGALDAASRNLFITITSAEYFNTSLSVGGLITVSVEVSDDNGIIWSAIDTFDITITQVNDAPQLAGSITSLTGVAGAPITFNIQVNEGGWIDEDAQEISNLVITPATFTCNINLGAPVGDGFVDSSTFILPVTITPPASYNGTQIFTLQMTDSFGGVGVTTFSHTWGNGNISPTISNDIISYNGNENYIITGHAIRIDEGGSDDSDNLLIRVAAGGIADYRPYVLSSYLALSWGGNNLIGVVQADGAIIYNVGDFALDASIYPVVMNMNFNDINTSVFGDMNIDIDVSDDGGSSWISAVDDISLSIGDMGDYPTISTTSSNKSAYLMSPFNLIQLTVDEGGWIDEDLSNVTIQIDSSNQLVLPLANINIYYGEDISTATFVGAGGGAHLVETIAANNCSDQYIFIEMISSNSTGFSTITITATNGTPLSTSINFNAIVEDLYAYHGIWNKIYAVGAARDRKGNIRTYCSSDLFSNRYDCLNSGADWIEDTAKVEFGWDNFSLVGSYGGSISGWRVFKSSTSNPTDYGVQIGADLPLEIMSFSDTTINTAVTNFTTNIFRSIYIDGDNVYLASDDGIFISKDMGLNFYQSLSSAGSDISMVAALSNLVVYTTSTGAEVSLDGGNSFISVLGGVDCTGVAIDSHDRIFIVSDVGIYRSDDDGVNWSNITIASGLISDDINHIFIDASDDIYISTDIGLSISDSSGVSWINYTNINSNILSNNINSTYVTTGGVLLLATNGGVSVKAFGGSDFINFTTYTGLISNNVKSIWSDDLGNIYVATDIGVSVSNNSGGSFTSKTMADGLGSNSTSFTYGADQILLVTTDNGLAVTNDSGLTFSNRASSGDEGIAFWYKVRPIVDNQVVETASAPVDNLRIVIPPSNKALIHRYMANIDICTELGLGFSSYFSCSYTGPGGENNSFYDFGYDGGNGYDLLVDRFEVGCPYGDSTACSIGGVDQDCIDSDDPTLLGIIGNDGSYFYNRRTGACYERVAGVWGVVTTLSSKGNMVYLPPLVNVTQSDVDTTCRDASFNETLTIDGIITNPSARPLQRREQIIASKWDLSMSSSMISTIESGSDLLNNSRCNSNFASGILFSDMDLPEGDDSLSATNSNVNNMRNLISGSKTTIKCISKYGIQDLVGNVRELVSDRMNCNSDYFCTDITPALHDGTNNYFYLDTHVDFYDFNYGVVPGIQLGPCADEDASGVCGDLGDTIPLDRWVFENGDYDASKFFLPMGLPAVDNISTVAMGAIDINPSYLHGDEIDINAQTINAASQIGVFTTGGSYFSGGGSAGRYTLEMIDSGASDYYTGFRCATPVAYP